MKIRYPSVANITVRDGRCGAALVTAILALALAACDKQASEKDSGEKDQPQLKSSLRPKQEASPSPGSAAPGERLAKPVDPESEKLRKILAESGSGPALGELSRMTVERLRAFLSDQNLKHDRQLNGLAALAFAEKAGPSGNKSDLAIIAGASCEVNQMGAAAAEFFKLAQTAGKQIDPRDFSDFLGSGAKRDQLIRGYYSAVSKPLDQILAEVKELGFPEDARNALEGAARSRKWTISELVPLLGTESEDLIPKFTSSLTRGALAGHGDATALTADWNALNAIPDEASKLNLKGYAVSELGRRDPQTALTLLAKESPEDRQALIQDPKFANVVRNYSSQDPVECLKFITSSELPSEQENRLVGVAMSQWLALDSRAAGKWVTEQAGKPYYDFAATKMAAWARSKGDKESALIWENSIPK